MQTTTTYYRQRIEKYIRWLESEYPSYRDRIVVIFNSEQHVLCTQYPGFYGMLDPHITRYSISAKETKANGKSTVLATSANIMTQQFTAQSLQI